MTMQNSLEARRDKGLELLRSTYEKNKDAKYDIILHSVSHDTQVFVFENIYMRIGTQLSYMPSDAKAPSLEDITSAKGDMLLHSVPGDMIDFVTDKIFMRLGGGTRMTVMPSGTIA